MHGEIGENQPGQDSFLDIVANIVGILIILGIVVGIRARREPVVPPSSLAELSSLQAVAERKQAEVFRLRKDLEQLHAAYATLETFRAQQQALRDRVAVEVAALEKLLQAEGEALAREEAEAVSLQIERNRKLQELTDLQRHKTLLEEGQAEIVEIQHYPAPVAKLVDSKEVHFQVQNNRVAHIPLEQLIEEVKRRARSEASRLVTQNEWTDSVGPAGGFQLRFVLRRYDVPIDMPGQNRATASYVRVEHWVLLPVSPHLGEPVEEALKPGSRFWDVVRRYSNQETVVTLWVYPESFGAYRQLRAALHAAGYACAARPLPSGVPISGSPRGSKSAAQ